MYLSFTERQSQVIVEMLLVQIVLQDAIFAGEILKKASALPLIFLCQNLGPDDSIYTFKPESISVRGLLFV